MSDYICREDAVDTIKKNFKYLPGYMNATINYIKELPPADVVQVVRCENCVHWSDSNQCARPELSGSRWHDAKYFETMPDDFCSYGERREG